MTDLVVLDTLALKEEQFQTGYYIKFFQFFIKKNEVDYFTIVIIVDLWSCKDVRQALEISINNSKFNYNMTNTIYRYKKQNGYSYDMVLTIHFYTS